MQKTRTSLGEIKLVGLTARTNNQLEKDPTTAQIPSTVQEYFQQGCATQILHRKKPGVTYSVYTHYESDVTGDYTYFIGEEVTSFAALGAGLEALTIPAQSYAKFTTAAGPMPAVCIQAWQHVWSLNASQLGGERAYQADFEVYDERAHDPQQTILDLYVGIKP